MPTKRVLALALALIAMGLGIDPARADPDLAKPPEGIVWYVLNVLNAQHLDIDDPTNRPPVVREIPHGVLTAVDVSPDGKPDWLVAWPEDVAFCGTGGCRHTLYVSTPDGFTRAFDRQAFTVDVRRAGQGGRLEATVHSLYCSDDRPDCRLVWRWDGDTESLRPASDQAGDHPPPVDPGITR